jgi:hypothetical protein
MEFILQTGNAQQSVSLKQQILSKFSQEEIFQKVFRILSQAECSLH